MPMHHEFFVVGTVATPARGEAPSNMLVVKFDDAVGGRVGALLSRCRFPSIEAGTRIKAGVQFCETGGLQVLTISDSQPQNGDWAGQLVPPVLGHQ